MSEKGLFFKEFPGGCLFFQEFPGGVETLNNLLHMIVRGGGSQTMVTYTSVGLFNHVLHMIVRGVGVPDHGGILKVW